jgi:hypothetical protein
MVLIAMLARSIHLSHGRITKDALHRTLDFAIAHGCGRGGKQIVVVG